MSAFAPEMYYPDDQYETREITDDDGVAVLGDDQKPKTEQVLRDGAKGYMIKPLTSLQFTEIQTLGSARSLGFRFNFDVIKRLLSYGLEHDDKKALIENMPSVHHGKVAQEIFFRSAMADEERKNS